MTYEKIMNEESESQIEIVILIRCVLEKWRILVASGLICALLGVIIAAVTYVPQYTATISYVINSKSTSNDSTLNPNDFLVAEYLANTYSYLIKSRDFVNNIKMESGINEDIKGYISSHLVDSSSIMKVVVRTEDPQKTFSIARAISIYLPERAKAAVRSGSLDPLEDPVEPVSPDGNSNLMKMGLIGLILGVVLSAAVIVFIQMIKKVVMTPNDLTNKVDITHIGSIPHVDINKKKSPNTKHEPVLVTNKKTGFVFSETYKSMRTKIERFSKKNNAKAILITSALENEGKTTVAANIALALAQNNNKVLLMDCDLRKPAVATVLDAKDKVKVPAIDVIKGIADVENAIIRLDNKLGLDIIGGDKPVGNSSEILSTRGFKKALDYLREKYDYILVDTPPSQLFTDAAIISEYTDAAVLVVRQNGANVDDIIGVINDVSQSKAELIGFVFNNVSDTSILPGGYSKKYNYSYYGYGRNE